MTSALSSQHFLKLFDPRILSILLSCNSQGSTNNQYFMIKCVILFLVVFLIYRITSRNIVERKNLFLREILPILMKNSIRPKNDILKELMRSSYIHRSIILLLYLPKTKKRNSSCKISNKTVARIEILFKEKGYFDQSKDHLDSISNISTYDSKYHTLINQREIQLVKKSLVGVMERGQPEPIPSPHTIPKAPKLKFDESLKLALPLIFQSSIRSYHSLLSVGINLILLPVLKGFTIRSHRLHVGGE
ncbi:hypothetical protein CDL12_14497 [Handroanthus impetiginosus]|uniref:Ycf2 N-terminal domain-containing protein n=1 Tax=Handroanthus impetiginosus TaxID=429701 RepID=A0A2G9H5T9_9LAMI|nr:hypothetical protein CDL12_14497 [Handroanthus impetiginosus]